MECPYCGTEFEPDWTPYLRGDSPEMDPRLALERNPGWIGFDWARHTATGCHGVLVRYAIYPVENFIAQVPVMDEPSDVGLVWPRPGGQ